MLAGDDRGKPAPLVWRQPLSYELQEGWIANRHLRHVQARLADQLADNLKTYGAVTTLAAAHLRGRRAAVLNVGDLPVYHGDGEGRWRQLAKDHTVLQGMLDRGEASLDQEYASI